MSGLVTVRIKVLKINEHLKQHYSQKEFGKGYYGRCSATQNFEKDNRKEK